MLPTNEHVRDGDVGNGARIPPSPFKLPRTCRATGWASRAGIARQGQQSCEKGPKSRLIGLISLRSESEETQWLPR